MSGKASRDKGMRHERYLVNLFRKAGLFAERVPLSGAAGGSYAGDISVPVLGHDWTLEAKVRSHGFAQLYGWLGDNHALIVKADRSEPLVVLPLRRAIEVLKQAERYRTGSAA